MDPHVVLDMNRIDGSDASHGHEAIEEAVTRYVGAFEDYTYTVPGGKIAGHAVPQRAGRP